MLVRKYVDENGLAAMLAAKRSVGVTPEVNLREHTSCMPLQCVNKAAHSGFESPKQSISGPTKDMCPPTFSLKKKTTSYVSLRLRVQNGISRLIFALWVNCLISIPEYSRIIDYSIIWLSTCVTVFNTC